MRHESVTALAYSEVEQVRSVTQLAVVCDGNESLVMRVLVTVTECLSNTDSR